ncbi:unnamed protein product [Choristocarpus tenellus]
MADQCRTIHLLLPWLSIGLIVLASFAFRGRSQNAPFGLQVGPAKSLGLQERPTSRRLHNPSTEWNSTTEHGYECWPGDFDCYHQEPLPFPMYPITPEMFKRSIPFEGSSFLLHQAFRKARISGVLNVVIMGGSMTLGHGCTSPRGLSGKECAWGGRLQQWFDKRLSGIRVKILNRAIQSCALCCHLPHLSQTIPSSMDVDIIIADFGINDSYFDQYYNGKASNLLVDHEAFISYVFGLGSRPALIYVEGFHPGLRHNAAEVHRLITERYEVPMVSYRHAIWPNKTDTSDVLRLWAVAGPHPPWQTHQLFADVLIQYLQREYVDFCSRFGGSDHQIPFMDGVTERAEQTCLMGHLTYMDTTEDFPMEPVVELSSSGGSSNGGGSAWVMGEDVPGKPGLLVYGMDSPGASVVFNLSCHSVSSIAVGYLGSYEGMGMVEVLIDGKSPNPSGSGYWIDGLWDEQISVQTFNFVPLQAMGPSPGKVNGVTEGVITAGKQGAVNTSNVLLTLRTPMTSQYRGGKTVMARRGSAKFKLLSLSCC